MPSKHSRVSVKHFTEDSFEQNLVVRSLLGPSFKLRQLVEKKDVDVTKTGNGEWGMGNGEWGMGNGEWGMGNGKLKNGKLKNGEWEI